MKYLSCLVCGINIHVRLPFQGDFPAGADSYIFDDGKKVYKLLEELSLSTLEPKDLKEKCFCKLCLKKCQDCYDAQKSLKAQENEILTLYKRTIASSLNQTVLSTKETTIRRIKTKAQKTVQQNRSLLKTLNRPAERTLVKSVASNEIGENSIASHENFERNVASIKKSIVTIDMESLPKEFMERFGSKHIIINTNNSAEETATTTLTIQNNEIVEEGVKQDADETSDRDDEMETEYLLGDVEILAESGDDDDDESETILMSDSGLLQVVKGSANKYITLLNDSQDSNDESQIELQVTGDQETADAIIAAAQQQGCTYIEVDSSEMVRVKTPSSELGGDLDDDPLAASNELQEILVYNDNEFQCQLCRNRDEPAAHYNLKHKQTWNSCKATRSIKKCSSSSMNELFSTYDPKVMMKHTSSEHNTKVYICLQCHYVAKGRSDYSQHTAKEHKSKQSSKKGNYECSECHARFKFKSMLDKHFKSHKKTDGEFTCSLCQKNFASKYILQSHYKTHSTVRERPFSCSTCLKSFYTIHNLTQHEKTHTATRDFKCKTCGKAFLSRNNMEIHTLVHTKVKPFICGVCDKAFARKPEISDHMRTHTGERPFACNMCSLKFSQRSNLHSHKRNTHFQEKRHACNQCDKRFKRRRLLDYHIKAIHTGERPLVCDICNATFIYPEHLRKHALIHNAERAFSCEICGKKFNTKDSRNTHRFTHSDKKPYECLVCGTGFMRKTLLYTHMTTSGHITESIVVNQPRVSQITDDTNAVNDIVEENNDVETTQGIAEDITTVETDNAYGEASGDQGNTLYIAADDGGNSSICLTTTDVQKIVTNEDGSCVRLVQVKLPGGGEGWIALEELVE